MVLCCLSVEQKPQLRAGARRNAQAAARQAKGLAATHLAPQIQPPVASTSSAQQIHFKGLACSGRAFELQASDQTSVQELKAMVQRVSGVQLNQQILYVSNVTLEDGMVLRDYKLKGSVPLTVVHRVYGG
ncbi:hypothetical protein scyTo_0028047 [Scyliorhinus torazame]|uniref:Ubiquitin-like domain-containing protein n=1 Tax=Scyliorhinus torazame TaxID=75743 RepID=A0A401QPW0_SCYTO|nr:hypothetical protein [Scyliorhinus torazame]